MPSIVFEGPDGPIGEIKLTEREMRLLKQAARKARVKFSTFVRDIVLRHARKYGDRG